MRKLVQEQKFTDSNFAKVVVGVLLMIPVGIIVLKFESVSEDYESIFGIAIAMSATALSALIMVKMKSKVVLSDKGVEYTAAPFSSKLSLLAINDIDSWNVTNHKWYHGLGYKYSLKAGKLVVLKPGMVLTVKNNKGKKFTFGINNPRKVENFISDQWPQNSSYG